MEPMAEVAAEVERRLAADPGDGELALLLAAAALPATGLDLVQAHDDARTYVESFPLPGRQVIDLREQGARWLAQRLESGGRRQALRAELERLATGWRADFPRTAAALARLLAEPVPADPRQDELWVAACGALIQEYLGR